MTKVMERVIRGGAAQRPPLPASVVTLGSFDGVHLGHQALLARTTSLARQRGVPSVAYTFDPHPTKVFSPERASPSLMALDERIRCLLAHGIDLVLVETFDAAFADLRPEHWVATYLVGPLHPQCVVVGHNFTYGRGGVGNVASLREAGDLHAFDLEVIAPVSVGSDFVSSSRVRELLSSAGDVAGARALLGRNFAVTGRVVRGDARGRSIGFPTINVDPAHELLPRRGVYASRVEVLGEEGVVRPAVSNIGVRPTFEGEGVRVETHILDFSGELYGESVRIELVERIRDEQRFAGVEALVAQIGADVAAARRLLLGPDAGTMAQS
ncbi:MAG: bifunctional riboflavin kinase/FAD synthetase [Deltaproteobacteria bacterium]|nr:bifunctional riboflavin kinase/FAD synthetase [Deltaproteobacteria bacterium]